MKKKILKFLNIKAKLQNGNIIHLSKTNLAYIEPHQSEINSITYLFFNDCENVYINTLEKYIPFKELENYINLINESLQMKYKVNTKINEIMLI